MSEHRYTIRVTDGDLLMTVRTDESVEGCKNAVAVRVERWMSRARMVSAQHALAKFIEYGKWAYEITDENQNVVETGSLLELPCLKAIPS